MDLTKLFQAIMANGKTAIKDVYDGDYKYALVPGEQPKAIPHKRFKQDPLDNITLDGFRVACELEGLDKGLIRIESPSTVVALSPLHSDLTRDEIVKTVSPNTSTMDSGRWMPQDVFITDLMVYFKRDKNLDSLLQVVKNLSRESSLRQSDNGMTQEMTVKSGVKSDWERVENPITLTPWRTFIEADQPKSKYIFRVEKSEEKGIKLQLTLVENGQWEHEAVNNIRAWLKKHMKEAIIIG